MIKQKASVMNGGGQSGKCIKDGEVGCRSLNWAFRIRERRGKKERVGGHKTV